MFQRAVNTHTNDAPKSNDPLKQQLFPSSSPSYQNNTCSPGQKLSSSNKTGPLHPSNPNALNRAEIRPLSAKSAVKRTSSGLAKALGNDGHQAFQAPQTSSHSRMKRVAQGVQASRAELPNSNSQVWIDEDDFDSDIDLEVENPASKASVSYPKLAKPLNYPSLPQKASLHTQVSVDTGYQPRSNSADEPPPSTVPLPWSSSPQEYSAQALQFPSASNFVYNGQHTQIQQEPEADSFDSSAVHARPPKRRTLPWLDNEAQEAQWRIDAADAGHSSSVTPSTKKSNTKYPWNTTASAIKEQQKLFRKANKKPIKEGTGTNESRAAAIAAKKSKTVATPHLSAEQRHILDLIVEQMKSVFFTGSAGTGKSVLLREIVRVLSKKYARETDRVAITASTGLAACNIGGVTLHSFAGIGLGKEAVPELVKKIKRNQKAKHRWLRTKVLIIDEVSMVDGELFDKLEAIARQLRNNGRPFGGIQLVITGDFFQLPPVPEANKAGAMFCFDAKSWTSSIDHTIGLHHVFRQKDSTFANMLNEMREGNMSPDSVRAFRTLSRPLNCPDTLVATELFPTRNEVENSNRNRMQQLSGEARIFEARDGGSITDKVARDRLLASCMAPPILELKKSSQVMLIKNIDDTLVNGSLGKVIGFMNEEQFNSYNAHPEILSSQGEEIPDEELSKKDKQRKFQFEALKSTSNCWPLVRFQVADGTTRDLLCNRETWKVELPNGEVQASRSQVPLILAWALSIHKAQGQTLDWVKVDLRRTFEKGQAYVALSRATRMDGLQVLGFDPQKVVAHERVRNFYSSLSRAENAARGNLSPSPSVV